MAFLVCLLFRESIGVAITKSFVIFVRKFFVFDVISSSQICSCSHLHLYGSCDQYGRLLNALQSDWYRQHSGDVHLK